MALYLDVNLFCIQFILHSIFLSRDVTGQLPSLRSANHGSFLIISLPNGSIRRWYLPQASKLNFLLLSKWPEAHLSSTVSEAGLGRQPKFILELWTTACFLESSQDTETIGSELGVGLRQGECRRTGTINIWRAATSHQLTPCEQMHTVSYTGQSRKNWRYVRSNPHSERQCWYENWLYSSGHSGGTVSAWSSMRKYPYIMRCLWCVLTMRYHRYVFRHASYLIFSRFC